MLERDLQEYLFTHPEVLFPGETIQEKSREVCIEGRRIDLLFRINNIRHIIELKAVPLTREHIGQVVEYYGLMRNSLKDGKLKMVLVAPSIPDYRKVYLEELGIRCIEIANVPSDSAEVQRLRKDASAGRQREKLEEQVSSWLPNFDSIRYDDLVTGITKKSLAISHRVLHDSLEDIRKRFAEYEVVRPIKMLNAWSHDRICASVPRIKDFNSIIIPGGAWWAYSFGAHEEMPKNDVPNISVMAMPWSLDLAINAELRTSQAVMKKRILEDTSRFDDLTREHGGVQFQAILKLEHQPRFYYWIPLQYQQPGTWCAQTLIDAYNRVEREYSKLRELWIPWIEKNCTDLSRAQLTHMRGRNKEPNVALRLVRPFRKEDAFWSLPYDRQCEKIVTECERLKPLVDFFQ